MFLIRPLFTLMLLLGSSAFASGVNFGVGINYLGMGTELEWNLDDHNMLVIGLGGFPLPGAGFVGLETPRLGGGSGAVYLGHKYLFSPNTNSFFLTARYGFHKLGGSFGSLGAATFSANFGYRFFEVRFFEQTSYYLDLEVGGFLTYPGGFGYVAGPTALVNVGFRF